jgi:hypothetical protein
MDIKVIGSIALSFFVAYLVYSFNHALVTGLDLFLRVAYLIVIWLLVAANIFLIFRQKLQSRKVVMIIALIVSLLSSMILSRVYIPKEDSNGIPRRYEETL